MYTTMYAICSPPPGRISTCRNLATRAGDSRGVAADASCRLTSSVLFIGGILIDYIYKSNQLKCKKKKKHILLHMIFGLKKIIFFRLWIARYACLVSIKLSFLIYISIIIIALSVLPYFFIYTYI